MVTPSPPLQRLYSRSFATPLSTRSARFGEDHVPCYAERRRCPSRGVKTTPCGFQRCVRVRRTRWRARVARVRDSRRRRAFEASRECPESTSQTPLTGLSLWVRVWIRPNRLWAEPDEPGPDIWSSSLVIGGSSNRKMLSPAAALPFGAAGTLIPEKALVRVSEERRWRRSNSPAASFGSRLRSRIRIWPAPTSVPLLRAASESQATKDDPAEIMTAADVVKLFYDGVNRRDLQAVKLLIAEDCVYEDLVFPQPFVGRKAILEFFKKFTESTSSDLQFVIDEISNEDSYAVGVTWHLEWRGKPFPFSKGCSFYRLQVWEGKRQIVYGRDCVEPAAKPGDSALVIIQAVTWLLERFPQLVNQFR